LPGSIWFVKRSPQQKQQRSLTNLRQKRLGEPEVAAQEKQRKKKPVRSLKLWHRLQYDKA